MNKRDFIKSVAFSATAISFMGITSGFRPGKKLWNGEFAVPAEVGYYGDLSPFTGAGSLKSHIELHKKYAEQLNRDVQDLDIKGISAIGLFKNMSEYPVCIRENAGGYFNHKLFWKVLSPAGDTDIKGNIFSAVKRDFGSYNNFKKQFLDSGMSLFGSGWVWLIYQKGRLKISSTGGNDNPLMNTSAEQGRPLLCLDLWEHAWDNYHNGDREKYINTFWSVADWSFVEKRYKGLLSQDGILA